MIIRQVTIADLPIIAGFEAEIARISFPENPIVDLQVHQRKLRKALESAPEGMFAAQIDGRVVGWLWITLNTNFATAERYATFRSVAVSPEWRGKGIGRSLVEFGVDYCRRHSARWIASKVHVDNAAMRALFHAAGFRPKHVTMEFRLEDETDDEA